MNTFIHNWANAVVRGRWVVLAITTLAIGLAFLPMKNLYYDNSNELFFLEGDPNLVAFNDLLDLFGDAEYLSIGITTPEGQPDVFTPETLAVIDALTRFLEQRPEVTQVRSLTRYQYTHSGGGMMATDDLIEDATDPDLLDDARSIM
ncbi:MAG: RND family transporter, partial [Natronospirillum sp.]